MSERPSSKILIVDDEAVQVRILCAGLKNFGYETVGFTSATAALTELGRVEFDLLLSDLMMPEMNGIELLKAALKLRPNLVGIIMTGAGTITTAVEAMKSGALDYVLKPFDLATMAPVLERALEVQRLRLKNAALERQVRERTAQLELANKELEAFSYSVSHDLRAPARHVGSFANLIRQSETSMSDKGKHYLEVVSESAARMLQLIDDLLDFSRNSRAEIHRKEIEVGAVVAEVIQSLQPEAAGRNIVWKKGAFPAVQADVALIRQVFVNLLQNAIKYTRQRDPAEIEIGSLDNVAGEVVLFVRDNGAGFDMKYVGKLFGVFQRLHRSGEFEGTGVGLANVRRIIARHGGRTWAEGEINAGATFYFSLPK
jgi:two-component system sensor histidine kinase/response regulator